MRWVTMLALVVTMGACGRSSEVAVGPESAPFPGTMVAGACTGTVAHYCARTGGPCPAFDAAVAQRRGLCSQPGSWTVVERHCVGHFRSVRWREAVLGGGEEFFGAGGELLAARVTTDYPAYCDGQSFSQVFGSVPACPGEPVSTGLCGT